MLRNYGVHMVLHAAWVAAAVVLIVVTSNVAPAGRVAPYIVAVNILTTINAAASAIWFAGLEWVRGAHVGVWNLAAYVLAFALVWTPVALCVPIAATMRSWLTWCFLLANLALAATLAIPLSLGVWSLRELAANIACLASASALAHIYCRKKV